MQGQLVIKPLFGSFVKDEEWFGTQDPYVIIQLGGQTQKSSVCKDGGKNPRWSDCLTFNSNGEPGFSFKVMDRDHISSDDELGVGQVALNQVYQTRSVTNAFPCFRKGKPYGTVTFSIDFIGGQGGQGGFGGGAQGGWGNQQQGGAQWGNQQGGGQWGNQQQGGGQWGQQQGGFGGQQQGGFGGQQQGGAQPWGNQGGQQGNW
jgi:hypothetical protein